MPAHNQFKLCVLAFI